MGLNLADKEELVEQHWVYLVAQRVWAPYDELRMGPDCPELTLWPSKSNHSDHETSSSQNFVKFIPVVGVVEIW